MPKVTKDLHFIIFYKYEFSQEPNFQEWVKTPTRLLVSIMSTDYNTSKGALIYVYDYDIYDLWPIEIFYSQQILESGDSLFHWYLQTILENSFTMGRGGCWFIFIWIIFWKFIYYICALKST